MSDVILSVILPAKNEAERLPLALVDIDKRLSEIGFPSEIVVVSCGSTDKTSEIVKKLAEAIKNLKLVTAEEDKGYGFALRQGMLLSSGQFRLAAEVANLIPVDQFNQMKSHLENGADLVIGERSGVSNISDSISRKILRRISNFLLRKFFFKELKDPSSSFIAFKAEAAEKIFNQTKYHRTNLLLEPVFLAKRSNFRIQEIPIFIG